MRDCPLHVLSLVSAVVCVLSLGLVVTVVLPVRWWVVRRRRGGRGFPVMAQDEGGGMKAGLVDETT